MRHITQGEHIEIGEKALEEGEQTDGTEQGVETGKVVKEEQTVDKEEEEQIDNVDEISKAVEEAEHIEEGERRPIFNFTVIWSVCVSNLCTELHI